jgi:general secretion pathway protein D
MDVPILGWLFKRKTTSEDKVSLFIFLTPYVIEKPEDLSKSRRSTKSSHRS